ncbi:winged helix-turn-helix domain-containing protein [Nocardioides sp. zg-DK7169]|uniref:winged helix-turn-helix domain-containing protein n=1 Tax=Nocardioides sp. zg-DK7169 TaxID=2736600 RepID=UPI00155279DA|nr:crosslink repair DNA glycosylase YcaQ family protein [Nocardioides sp. zg-DK7169]NPC95937.1 winged helix-turn-helix domain-containing protein [Nocardioides sp. zg-DK7169]
MESLSTSQARRVALAAQGFLDPAHAVPTMRTLSRAVARTGVLQVDSVNVLQRAHLMPVYSRIGPYDTALLTRAAERRPRRLVEYWAHVQALMPVELWPHMQHRMAHYRELRGKWGFSADHSLEDAVRREVTARGPSTAREIDAVLGSGAARTREHWGWNWSETRKVLDHLYMSGQLAVAGRNAAFEVRYDLPERVLPPHVLAAPVPDPAEAARELVRRAARSHGVATLACLRDYYRMPLAETRTAVAELVEDGELLPVQVEGWGRPAYLHRDARVPRRVGARALLSPFDPLVWERERTERLFGFRYRIEIYVPAEQRVHGYYVLPFLLGERIVARVDLKAERRIGRLLVQAAHAEPGAPADAAHELAAELATMAGWLGLDAEDPVVVAPRGDLAPQLAAAVREMGGSPPPVRRIG